MTHHAYKCEDQSEGCNSYELYIQSATWKSRLPPRVTNNRSTRRTSLVTETVDNERTNLLTSCQLKSIGVVVLTGEDNIRDSDGVIFFLDWDSVRYLWLR